MSAHDHNVIMVCSAADLEQVNAIATAMGHTNRELSRALAPTKEEPATHYACCPAVTRGFAKMLTQAPPAPDVIEPGDTTLYAPLPADQLDWLRANVDMSVNPPLDPEEPSYPTPRAHFDAVIASMGLVEVVSEEMV